MPRSVAQRPAPGVANAVAEPWAGHRGLPEHPRPPGSRKPSRRRLRGAGQDGVEPPCFPAGWWCVGRSGSVDAYADHCTRTSAKRVRIYTRLSSDESFTVPGPLRTKKSPSSAVSTPFQVRNTGSGLRWQLTTQTPLPSTICIFGSMHVPARSPRPFRTTWAR